MRTRIASLIVSAAAVLLLISMPVPGQGPGPGRGKGKGKGGPKGEVMHKPIPRTADGHPNMSGTWQGFGVSINGEAGAPPLHPLPPIDAHAFPRDRAPSYTAKYEAIRQQKNFGPLDDPTLYCFLPGVPRITGMPMPLEIVQTPKEVVILYEAFRAWRRIPINDKLEHPDDLTPTWMGDSVGRWEGDTFVVDVTGFNDRTWIGGSGTIHSEKMHVVERYTLNDDGSLTYEATVDDPEALTKPYHTGSILRAPIDVRVEEYECIENNPDPGHMKKAEDLESAKK
jgi:hypothetical protein